MNITDILERVLMGNTGPLELVTVETTMDETVIVLLYDPVAHHVVNIVVPTWGAMSEVGHNVPVDPNTGEIGDKSTDPPDIAQPWTVSLWYGIDERLDTLSTPQWVKDLLGDKYDDIERYMQMAAEEAPVFIKGTVTFVPVMAGQDGVTVSFEEGTVEYSRYIMEALTHVVSVVINMMVASKHMKEVDFLEQLFGKGGSNE